MKAVGLYRYLPIDDPESFLDLEMDTPGASGRDLNYRLGTRRRVGSSPPGA